MVGVDWRVPLGQARTRIGASVAVQGNLDPAVVVAGWEATRERAEEVLQEGGGRGHIFNLGHGVMPQTDPGVLAELVAYCHARGPVS